MTLSKDYDNE